MLNAITVDLEDWGQSVIDPALPVTDRVLRNTDRVLELLDEHGLRATFFALGRVCEAFPRLLPRIAQAGHEVASHGYGHELIYRITPKAFREDVRRSAEIIAEQTGRRPIGYRAPAFSITERSRWAGPILSELGFRYSSSVFPIAGRRYGIADEPPLPHRWPDCGLIEFPPMTIRLAGRNWPICGGGYTRLVPLSILSASIRARNRAGSPAVVYLHPYELAPGETQEFRREGVRFSWRRQFTQELWRSRVPLRLAGLFKRFHFGTMAEALSGLITTGDFERTECETEDQEVALPAIACTYD